MSVAVTEHLTRSTGRERIEVVLGYMEHNLIPFQLNSYEAGGSMCYAVTGWIKCSEPGNGVASVEGAYTDPAESVSPHEASSEPVYVNCFGTGARHAQQHPKTCNLYGDAEDEANLTRLANARWSGWGSVIATATGDTLPTGTRSAEYHGQGTPTTIRLSDIRRGCGDRDFYSRLETTRSIKPQALSDGC